MKYWNMLCRGNMQIFLSKDFSYPICLAKENIPFDKQKNTYKITLC